MACEPLHDDLAHSDARNLAAHTVYGEAEHSPQHLYMVGADAQRESHHTGEVGADGPPLDECSAEHERRGHDSREADAELVEDDAAEEQQQQEHVKISV